MTAEHYELFVDTRSRGSGLHEITDDIQRLLATTAWTDGLVNVFVRHTSCSLMIQENADPTAAADLEAWFSRLAPIGDSRYTHTLEGPDDMPAHLRSSVTRTSEQIPLIGGVLGLGTWQGLYLFEHRRQGGLRRLWVTVLG